MSDDATLELVDDFALEARERLARIQGLLLDMADAPVARVGAILDPMRREWHTLKGNAGMMGLTALQALAHEAESLLDTPGAGASVADDVLELVDRFQQSLEELARPARPDAGRASDAPVGEGALGSVRVPFATLDELVDVLAEMVIFRNRLGDTIASGRAARRSDGGHAWDDVAAANESLGKTLGVIQDRVMQLRMVPLQSLFGRLRRLVHDEARRTGKEVHLQTSGGETPLDKALLEVASEALGHLVRNAVTHGIELPALRRARGKAPTGTILLTAAVRGGEVRIEIQDDGSGVRVAALVAAAAARGHTLCPGDDPLSLLFLDGVSTHGGTDLSAGRGVGLAAAQRAVHRAGGRIDVTTLEEAGSCFTLQLPLSVSITHALLVKADREEYAVPLTAIVESLRLRATDDHELNHAGTYRWRGGLIPLVDLGVAFGTARARRAHGCVVVVCADGKVRGLVGDDLTGIREIVAKRLDPVTGCPPGVAGATILGDGRVVLILDPQGVMTLRPFVLPGEATRERPDASA